MSMSRRTDVPSVIVTTTDSIVSGKDPRQRTFFKNLAKEAETRTPAEWVKRDIKTLSGSVVRLPERSEIDGNLE